MKFNPKIHHCRSIRLKGYDYSQEGLYFITICCENNICRFGNIENEEMILNDFGQIAHNEWLNLAERFDNFELDTFQIMPNHIHSIISLKVKIGQSASNDNENSENNSCLEIWAGASPAPTTADIIGSYKSLVANGCLGIYKSKNEIMGKLWQRNYYEHIIRDENSYQTISNYVENNPSKWLEDKFFTKAY